MKITEQIRAKEMQKLEENSSRKKEKKKVYNSTRKKRKIKTNSKQSNILKDGQDT